MTWVISFAAIQQSCKCSHHTAPFLLPPALLIPVILHFSKVNMIIVSPHVLLFTLKAMEILTTGPATHFLSMFPASDKKNFNFENK